MKEKKNKECMELKNINYKSMLLKNKMIVDNDQTYSKNAEEILQNEITSCKNKKWNKLSLTVKSNKIKSFSKRYCSENNIKRKKRKVFDVFLKNLLLNKKITRNKDVDYDLSSGKLIEIFNIEFNNKTNSFTLKSVDKKKSILSGLSKKNLLKFKNKTHKNKGMKTSKNKDEQKKNKDEQKKTKNKKEQVHD